MVGLPNKPMGFPTKNDQHLGCVVWGYIPPFKETPICKQRELIDQHRTSLFLTTEIVVVNPGGDSTSKTFTPGNSASERALFGMVTVC